MYNAINRENINLKKKLVKGSFDILKFLILITNIFFSNGYREQFGGFK